MSRALYTLSGRYDRERATNLIRQAPTGTRVEFKGPRRSNDQNSKMWAMLTEVAHQREHFGRKLSPDTWKYLFMHACDKEIKVERSLDGEDLVPIGGRSSELSKTEMSDLIEFMHGWGAENGVVFKDDIGKGDTERHAAEAA